MTSPENEQCLQVACDAAVDVFAPHRLLRAMVMPAGRGMGAPQPAAGAAEPGKPPRRLTWR